MGAQQSSPQLTLAEKRYRVGSPERIRSRRAAQKQKTKSASSSGISSIASSEPGTSNGALFSKASRSVTADRLASSSGRPGSRSSSDMTTSVSSSVSLNSGATANSELLSRAQKVLIENSWKRASKSGADNVGTKIFLLVLTAQPDIKMIFGLEKIPQGRLKYDPRFRKHALVFNRTFDYIVKNLNYTEKLVQHFRALGKKHVLMQGRGFLPQYWDTFAECMTQTAIEWEGGQRCRETMVAWRTLVAFIIKQMRSGFDEEKMARRKFTMSAMPVPVGGLPPPVRTNQYNNPMGVGGGGRRATGVHVPSQVCPVPSFSNNLPRAVEDEEGSEGGFYTPPSSRRAPAYAHAIRDDSGAESDCSEELWVSPRS